MPNLKTDADVMKFLEEDLAEQERSLYESAPTEDLSALDDWKIENAQKMKEIENRRKELARRKALLNLK